MADYLTYFDFDREQAKFIELLVLKIKSIYKCTAGRGIVLNHNGVLLLEENSDYEKPFISLHAEPIYILTQQELSIIIGYAVLQRRYVYDWLDWRNPEGPVVNQNEYLRDESIFSYSYIMLGKHFNKTTIAAAFIKYYVARAVALGLFTHLYFDNYMELVSHVASNSYERILSANNLDDINSMINIDNNWVENLNPLFKDFRLSFSSVKDSILESEFLNKTTFGYFEEQQTLLYKQYR